MHDIPAGRPQRTIIHIFALVVLGLLLYVPGLNWGIPAVVSWSQDSIAGIRTLGAVETWPHRWAGRYPPLHYFVLAGAYQPVLWHWRETGQMMTDPQSGKQQWSPPHAPKVGLLLLIAGAVSAAMAIGAGIILLFAARSAAAGDATAGLLAAIAFMCGAAFTYFAHLGNVDVPSIFWFSISLLFYVRLWTSAASETSESPPLSVSRPPEMTNSGLLGFFAAMTVCTKDGWIGLYPGMALALLIDQWHAARNRGQSFAPALRTAIFQRKWLAGLATFAAVFLLINAIPWNAAAYADRLRSWLSPASEEWVSHELRHNSLSLARETLLQAAGAVGWPMLSALLASALWLSARRSRLALLLFLPILSYYVIVIERMDFVYERFLFAPLMLLCVAGGLAGSKLLRSQRISSKMKFAVVIFVFVPTFGYAVAVDLELLHDSRYAAENWFRTHARPGAAIGAFTDDPRRFSPQYLPRVHEQGFATYPVLCRLEEFNRPQPEYLILSGFDQQDFSQDGLTCAAELLSGNRTYQPVAVFRPTYLGGKRSWLGIAGWIAPPPGKISPELTILHDRSARKH